MLPWRRRNAVPRRIALLARRVLLASLAAALTAAPAHARLGDRLGPAREYARSQGAQSLVLHPGTPPWGLGEPIVLAETWLAPAAGWSREEANALIKSLVNNRRRLRLKTSREGEGWTFTLRFEEGAVATCRYVDDRIRELHVRSAAFDEVRGPRPEPVHVEFPEASPVQTP
jgi:hypothetical protein